MERKQDGGAGARWEWGGVEQEEWSGDGVSERIFEEADGQRFDGRGAESFVWRTVGRRQRPDAQRGELGRFSSDTAQMTLMRRLWQRRCPHVGCTRLRLAQQRAPLHLFAKNLAAARARHTRGAPRLFVRC